MENWGKNWTSVKKDNEKKKTLLISSDHLM